MAIRMPCISQAKQLLRRSSLTEKHIPKGYFAVYVGEGEKKRFVVPISLLSQSLFQELLSRAEDEFGFDHPMGALLFPVEKMSSLISPLNGVDYEIKCIKNTVL